MTSVNGIPPVRAGVDESAACTVKFDVPLAVGTPESAPVLALRFKPGGRAPALTDHVYGTCPPAALSVRLYAKPTVPVGAVFGEMTIGGGGGGADETTLPQLELRASDANVVSSVERFFIARFEPRQRTSHLQLLKLRTAQQEILR